MRKYVQEMLVVIAIASMMAGILALAGIQGLKNIDANLNHEKIVALEEMGE